MGELTTAQMAEPAGVTQRTVQCWIKSGELQAKPIRGGYYAINPLDLVELSLPLGASATPKEKRLSYDELFDKFIEVQFDLDDLLHRLGQAEDKIERLNRRVIELTRERKTTTTRRKKRDTRKLLPYDYTPWRAFARLHGIPESTVTRAIKEQTLYVERGNWKSGGRTVREAFDYYERELFYDHFHTHPNLNPARTAHIHSSKEHAMQTIIDFLKIIAALAIIAAVSYYWFTEGPPPRGKGRWRSVLNALSDRRTRRR